jgi:hypothetical protein
MKGELAAKSEDFDINLPGWLFLSFSSYFGQYRGNKDSRWS